MERLKAPQLQTNYTSIKNPFTSVLKNIYTEQQAKKAQAEFEFKQKVQADNLQMSKDKMAQSLDLSNANMAFNYEQNKDNNEAKIAAAKLANVRANALADKKYGYDQDMYNKKQADTKLAQENLIKQKVGAMLELQNAQAANGTKTVNQVENTPLYASEAEADQVHNDSVSAVNTEQQKLIASFKDKYGFTPDLSKDLKTQIAERRFTTPALQDAEKVGLTLAGAVSGVPQGVSNIADGVNNYFGINSDKGNTDFGSLGKLNDAQSDFQTIKDYEKGKKDILSTEALSKLKKKVLTEKEIKTYPTRNEQISLLSKKLGETKDVSKQGQIAGAIKVLMDKNQAESDLKKEGAKIEFKEKVKAKYAKPTENKVSDGAYKQALATVSKGNELFEYTNEQEAKNIEIAKKIIDKYQKQIK